MQVLKIAMISLAFLAAGAATANAGFRSVSSSRSYSFSRSSSSFSSPSRSYTAPTRPIVSRPPIVVNRPTIVQQHTTVVSHSSGGGFADHMMGTLTGLAMWHMMFPQPQPVAPAAAPPPTVVVTQPPAPATTCSQPTQPAPAQ